MKNGEWKEEGRLFILAQEKKCGITGAENCWFVPENQNGDGVGGGGQRSPLASAWRGHYIISACTLQAGNIALCVLSLDL